MGEKLLSLQVGDTAPDFTLIDQHGKPFHLSEARQGHPVVLFFYPKSHTTICTMQACAFRDSYQDFVDAGAVVVGISSDDPKVQKGFSDKHRLPFTVLSDSEGAVREMYKVPPTLGLIPGRVTFVIAADGKICHSFNAQFLAQAHIDEALNVVQQLQS